MRNLLFTVCLGMMVMSASAAFSGSFSSTNAITLANGPNAINSDSHNQAFWVSTGPSQFTDGQFQNDGAYLIPVQGVYHFDATVQVQLYQQNPNPPSQTAALRLVRCNGCSTFCAQAGTPGLATTLVESGTVFLGDAWTGTYPPTYALTTSFTGYFNTGDQVTLCVDSKDGTVGEVRLNCLIGSAYPNCFFSGFAV